MEKGDNLLVHTCMGFGSIKGATFALLTITDVRHDVTGTYGSKGNTGYKAVDQYGISFEYAWDSWPDEATGGCVWWSNGTRDGQVIEKPEAWVTFTYVNEVLKQLKEKYPNRIEVCNIHNVTYDKRLYYCPECKALDYNTKRGLTPNREGDKIRY